MTSLAVERLEMAYEGRFKMPRVRVLTADSGILDHLYRELAPFESRLSDLKVETQKPDLSQAFISCNVYNFAGSVQIFADRIEVRAIDERATERFLDIVKAALAAVHSSQGDVELATHAFALSIHAQPDKLGVGEFLARFVKPAEIQDQAPIATSVSYTFGQDGARLNAFLAVEPSLLIPEGVFLRMYATYDASSLALEDAATKALGLLERMQSETLGASLTGVKFEAP